MLYLEYFLNPLKFLTIPLDLQDSFMAKNNYLDKSDIRNVNVLLVILPKILKRMCSNILLVFSRPEGRLLGLLNGSHYEEPGCT